MKWLLALFLLFPLYASAQATSDTSFCGITRTTTAPFTAASNTTYDGLYIDAAGANVNCIDIPNGRKNITIKHCYLKNSHKATGAIHIGKDCKNITIIYTRIDSSYRGVNIVNSGSILVTEADTNIHINYNRFYNIKDVAGHGNGGGSSVQFNNITGPGNQINYNDCYTTVVSDDVGDILSPYQTFGTLASPLQIMGNCVLGGSTLTDGKSGVIGGDVGGCCQVIKNNTFVNTGAQGGQVVGGTNINMSNNRAFGVHTAWGYEGFASGNFGGVTPHDDTVSNNHAKWFNRDGSRLDFYYSSAGGNPLPFGWGTNVSDETLSAAILPDPLFPVDINAGCTLSPPSISYTTPITIYTGTPVTLSATNTGGAVVSWSGSVPPGLSLNTSTGAITGTPTTIAGATNYVITATNTAGSDPFTINITVSTVAPPDTAAGLRIHRGRVKLE